jgi:hypothetical protein
MRLHAQAVSQHGAAGEGARRIDGNDADRQPARGRLCARLPRTGVRSAPNPGDEPIDERALARTGRPRHADQVRAPRPAENRADQIGARRIFVFDERNRPSHRARVAREHALGERVGHLARSCRAMTSR